MTITRMNKRPKVIKPRSHFSDTDEKLEVDRAADGGGGGGGGDQEEGGGGDSPSQQILPLR